MSKEIKCSCGYTGKPIEEPVAKIKNNLKIYTIVRYCAKCRKIIIP